VSLEYVEQVEGGGRGRTCRYVVTERGAGPETLMKGLTTPEELALRLGYG
jgi:hypothetical protein